MDPIWVFPKFMSLIYDSYIADVSCLNMRCKEVESHGARECEDGVGVEHAWLDVGAEKWRGKNEWIVCVIIGFGILRCDFDRWKEREIVCIYVVAKFWRKARDWELCGVLAGCYGG